MNVYLDDDMAKRSLAARLQKAGHQVALPSTAVVEMVEML
jgi:hypothetical protein